MAKVLTFNQIHKSPQDALAHYGVKGMRWGVRKDRPSTVGELSPEASVFAVYTAVFAGVAVIKARHNYVDSGKRDARKLDKNHQWPKKDSLKGPKTHEEIMRDVIPAINKGFPDTPGTSMNCRRCTFAFEMRRRGLDVKATKSLSATGQHAGGLEKATHPKDKSGAVNKQKKADSPWGQNAINTSVNGREMSPEGKARSIFDALARQPDGARGELAFSWAFGGGHSVAYEVINGKPSIFCTQSKQSWSDQSAFARDVGVILGDAAYTRLDNVELNNDFLKRWVADA